MVCSVSWTSVAFILYQTRTLFQAEKTHRWLGVSEMLVGVSIIGLVFAIFSGQPLLIVGATGPLLVFEEALSEVSSLYYISF